MAFKAAEFGRIMAIESFKVIQGHRFLQIESPYATSY